MHRPHSNTTLNIEQSTEWSTSVYISFIDSENMFDSLDRTTLWNLTNHYGIPTKVTSLIKNSYEGTSCKIIHAGQLSRSLNVRMGVKQGCLLSPFLLPLAIDWILRGNNCGEEK